jgi:hypothetical protein
MIEEAQTRGRLLGQLRGAGLERPPLDPDLAADLMDPLEQAAAPAETELAHDITVRVSKNRLRQVLLCEEHLMATLRQGRGPASADLVMGKLLDRVVAQLVAGYPFARDPVDDALTGARVANEIDLVDDWDALTTDDQSDVRHVVNKAASELADRWPSLPGNALVRLQSARATPQLYFVGKRSRARLPGRSAPDGRSRFASPLPRWASSGAPERAICARGLFPNDDLPSLGRRREVGPSVTR